MIHKSLLLFLSFLFLIPASTLAAPSLTSDIIFVTQVPFPSSANNLLSTSGNHRSTINSAPRGGDLYIRYANGILRNLTRDAGYGDVGLQGTNAIAVRDPCMHWDGDKLIFSMVVGAPSKDITTVYYWQLYELKGLGKADTPVILKVPGQPSNFNNIMPAYGSDDQIFYISDRPRDGSAHLFPQLDEALSFSTNTGLWKLNPQTSEILLIDHAPSGDFKPIVDSFGRVLMTRWDHLQRDQLGDDTDFNGAFNYSGETLSSKQLRSKKELFPEERSPQQKRPTLNLHNFNQFFPWQVNQDGSDLETLNHIGRHELRDSFKRSFTNDPSLSDFQVSHTSINQNRLDNFFHLHEDSNNPGLIYGVDAPQFDSHGAGQIVSLFAPPTKSADQITVNYITHRDTHRLSESRSSNHSGLYRDPALLSDGTLLASHSSYTGVDFNDGTREMPKSRYDFEIKEIKKNGDYSIATDEIVSPIVSSISYYDPSSLVTYNGPLWQLQPTEVKVRPRPPLTQERIFTPEAEAFQQSGVDVTEFKSFLTSNNLALIVGRNVTTRDAADRQQPFNLKVAGGEAQTLGSIGKIYNVSHLKIFQGDLLRAYGGVKHPIAGRRVIAQALHEDTVVNPPSKNGPPGAVRISSDGSIAAIVPAGRAISWELTSPKNQPVVRERYWLTMKPGEIRVCSSCHGLNTKDQANNSIPQNVPEALKYLLNYWKNENQKSPKFKLEFLSDKYPSRSKSTFYGGDTAQIKVTGLTDSAASKLMILNLKVGEESCAYPISHFVTSSDGKALLKGKLIKLESDKFPPLIDISLELILDEKLVARTKTTLRTVRGRNRSPLLSERQRDGICKNFEQFT